MISLVFVQTRFDYRFFLFAKFLVIEPCFTIEFVQLGSNLPPFFRIELGQWFEDLGLDHGGNLLRPTRGSKYAWERSAPFSPIARLGIVRYRAGDSSEAARIFSHLAGRESDPNLTAEVNGVINKIEREIQ